MLYREKRVGGQRASFSKNILIQIGSALAAALGLLAQNIPNWIRVVIGVYLATLVLLIVIPLAKQAAVWQRRRRTLNTVSKRYIPQIKHVLEGFNPQLEQSRTDTVFYVWNAVAGWDEAREWVKPAISHLGTLVAWRIHLQATFCKDGNAKLEVAAKEAADWILQYARVCEDAYYQLVPLLTENKLDERKTRLLKQDWNHVRDIHNRKLDEWVGLCRRINSDLGREICPTYCPTLKPLE